MIPKEQAHNRITALREELTEHNHRYYVLDEPTISDFEFDKMLTELQELEKEYPEFYDPNSPTSRVGGEVIKKFETRTHTPRMYSLDNTYSKEELVAWEARVKKAVGDDVEYVCELKYDGASISITYVNGQMLYAVTRGDGFSGDDITANIRTIHSIPLKLKGDYPPKFDIRGEIILPIEGFLKINKEREIEGEPLYANPRNLASGTLKLQDSSEVARRPLECLLYYVVGEGLGLRTQWESLQKARSWGFNVPTYSKQVKNMDEVFAFIDLWDKKRYELPFEIDGVVVKVNDKVQEESLGHTSKSPRWAVAFKFEAERASTRLASINYQVGRTGTITPVANLEPAVALAGTMVKRATLHNADQIEKLDLRIGDTVFVEKGGEIIPKIVGVDTSKRTAGIHPVEFITRCPECGTPLIRREGEVHYFCPNEDGCPPQIKGKIEHFASRKAMDIESLGEENVELLVQSGKIKSWVDLYDLRYDDVFGLSRTLDSGEVRSFQQRSAERLLDAIENSKQQPFEKVLFAIGIRFVGENMAKKLAKAFPDIDLLMNASYEELVEVDEIGGKTAESVIDYFTRPLHREFIERLKNKGLKLSYDKKTDALPVSDVLGGKSFVVSGKFSVPREQLKEKIELHGGRNVSSVSKSTDFLLAGEAMGPAKLKKATDMGVQVISEEDFFRMIDQTDAPAPANDQMSLF